MPEPREAVPLIIAALRDVFGKDLSCAILKGSVLKGDLIPYLSDLDIHAFVRGIGARRAVSWPQAVAFQARIGGLEPDAYGVGAFQVSFVDSDAYPEEWVPPVAGTYEVITGMLPAVFATVSTAAYVEHARRNLEALPGWMATLVRSYADKPDSALPRLVRLAGTDLKGALYNVGVALTEDPHRVLTAGLLDLVVLVGDATGCRQAPDRFYGHAAEGRQVRTRPQVLREMFAAAMEAFDAIVRWSAGS